MARITWLGLGGLVLVLQLLTLAKASPVRGLVTCLNHEECLGAHRHCHRNATMMVGRCVCDSGFKAALADEVKCLRIRDDECLTDEDCPDNLYCFEMLSSFKPNSLSSVFSGDPLDQLSFTRPQLTKRCIFRFGSGYEPKTGGALRPEFIEHYSSFGRRHNHIHGFHPHYVKFVEDAMLVLFLFCVLVTLLVVHRASCYRQFSNSRRNGHLRHIIPHRDDQPPPYDSYEADLVDGARVCDISDTSSSSDCAPAYAGGVAGGSARRERQKRRSGGRRGETPPPTYDEALIISQASNTPVPLYIALPAEQPQPESEPDPPLDTPSRVNDNDQSRP